MIPLAPQAAACASPHDACMRQAIALAAQARFTAAPNPCVGAVLVREGQVVASGFHAAYGQPHAEVECLRDAAARGVDPAGCTLYVTLEPCNHHGKTPPCTGAILEAGVRHVVVGAMDPNPLAAGGAAFLRERGVLVETDALGPDCAQACQDLLADFLVFQRTPRAVCLLKLAATLDGRIATRAGHSQWISGPESRRQVHVMRSQVQAVMVGGQTFRQDDPALTCRLEDGDICCQPFAVVVTSSLPPPSSTCQLLSQRPSQTIFFTPESIAAGHAATALRDCGATVWGLPLAAGAVGGLDLAAGLARLRQELGCLHVLCEGGGSLGRSLLEQGLADELHLYLSPMILGDANAAPVLTGRAPLVMDDAIRLRYLDVSRVGKDLRLVCRPEHAAPPAGGA